MSFYNFNTPLELEILMIDLEHWIVCKTKRNTPKAMEGVQYRM